MKLSLAAPLIAAAIAGCTPTTPSEPQPEYPYIQTPAFQMVLPGGQQTVQLPPGIRPGVTYQPSNGSLDPFDALSGR